MIVQDASETFSFFYSHISKRMQFVPKAKLKKACDLSATHHTVCEFAPLLKVSS